MFRLACLLLGLGLGLAGPGIAAPPLPLPQGPVLLTIEGEITKTNDGDRAIFDYEMLAAMPQTEVQTTTPWSQGLHTFTGPTLWHVMSLVGVQSDKITAHALNDFTSTFPLDDWRSEQAIIAITHNGKPLSPRSKGPLWIVMPFDDHPDYKSEVILSRSVWSLYRITVLP